MYKEAFTRFYVEDNTVIVFSTDKIIWKISRL